MSARFAMLLALLVAGPLSAAQNDPAFDQLAATSREASDIEQRYLERRRERAAEYRTARLRIASQLDATYHQAAAEHLAAGRAALRQLKVKRARAHLKTALEDYPYSDHAAAVTHELLRSYLLTGDLSEARLYLIDLHERFPGYEDFRAATVEALEVAEYIQRRGDLFDYTATEPDEIIRYRAEGDLIAANHIFHFLAQFGDRRIIGPRASLGIARSLLIDAGSSEERLVIARIAYDRFLESYPDHPLVFEALIEQATSYLLSYRGARYDTGVLLSAQDIIVQAELYIDNQPERAAIVRRFRALIRRWRQDRDLSIARWYRDRDNDEAAYYYYSEVIARDAASRAAEAARRERNELSEVSPGLGQPVEQP